MNLLCILNFLFINIISLFFKILLISKNFQKKILITNDRINLKLTDSLKKLKKINFLP